MLAMNDNNRRIILLQILVSGHFCSLCGAVFHLYTVQCVCGSKALGFLHQEI